MTSTVLHYVPRWLPLSEQFVDQAVRRSSYRPVVVARRGVLNLETFPQSPLVRLDRSLRLVPQRWQRQATGALLQLTLRRHRAALLHVHFGFDVLGSVGAARRAGVPLVVSLYGHDVTARTAAADPALLRVLAEADAVVVLSRYLAELAEQLGAPPERVHVLPVGVDLTGFSPQPLPEGPPTAVFVGRLVEKKGLDVLASAWPLVLRGLPEARLLVLGEGPVPVPVQAEHWTPDPARRQQQVREALARATAVVTPSRVAADGDSEGLLYVNLEAQASGRPVVTTRHAAIPEFVDPASAVLVPENDPEALAVGLLSVLAEPQRAAAMAAAGPAVASRFAAEPCAARTDALYARLING